MEPSPLLLKMLQPQWLRVPPLPKAKKLTVNTQVTAVPLEAAAKIAKAKE